jgi:acyl carrier protein
MPQLARDLQPLTRTIRTHILETFLTGDPPESLQDDDLLLEGGIVDSGSVISLVGFLEDRFGIRVDDDDLIVETFATVAACASS